MRPDPAGVGRYARSGESSPPRRGHESFDGGVRPEREASALQKPSEPSRGADRFSLRAASDASPAREVRLERPYRGERWRADARVVRGAGRSR